MHSAADTLRLGRSLAEARGALILLHGRGSSPEDILGLARALDADSLALLAPSAAGGAWYPHRFFVPLSQNEPWLTSALKTLGEVVDEVVAAKIPAERIGLVGFSQGGCLALEYAARSSSNGGSGGINRRFGFVAGLSGALIGPLDTPRPPGDLRHTPVLLGCAEADPHIPIEYVEATATHLEKSNAKVTRQRYRGSAHTVFPPEIEWLNQQLAGI